jgi:hypothetical protein
MNEQTRTFRGNPEDLNFFQSLFFILFILIVGLWCRTLVDARSCRPMILHWLAVPGAMPSSTTPRIPCDGRVRDPIPEGAVSSLKGIALTEPSSGKGDGGLTDRPRPALAHLETCKYELDILPELCSSR